MNLRTLEQHGHITPVTVTSALIGPLGHVDHYRYPELFYRAQIAFLQDRGFPKLEDLMRRYGGVPLAREERITYGRPLLRGEARIISQVYRVGNTSFRARQVIATDSDELIAIARYIFVLANLKGEPVPISNEFAKVLTSPTFSKA